MREFPSAVADLSHACKMAPRSAKYRYQRGVVYWQDKQPDRALQDFNAALALQPDDANAHLARATVLLAQSNAAQPAIKAEIKSDLDAASRLIRPASWVHLTLDILYSRIGDYPDAIAQVDGWLAHHPLEDDKATALNDRCWIRARANRDLHQALDDCTRALDLTPSFWALTGSHIGLQVPRDPDILDSRGLVYLRLGRLDDAIADYDAALRHDPKMPTSLYGRGIAELRLGKIARGDADLAAATKLDAGIADKFEHMGLSPPKEPAASGG